jgi:tetratricopeptide (TPR) repeat protein
MFRSGRESEVGKGRGSELFERAAEASPFHMESRFNVGSILLRKNQPTEAIVWLEEAAALAPTHPLVQDRLAEAYFAKGDLEEARKRFEAQARLDPFNPTPCLQLAGVWLAAANQEQALQWLGLAVQRGGEQAKLKIRADPTFGALDLAPLLEATSDDWCTEPPENKNK